MITWISPTPGGCSYQNSHANYEIPHLKGMLGNDFNIIRLMSDDLLLVRVDCKNSTLLKFNSLASILAKETICGNALIVEPKSFNGCVRPYLKKGGFDGIC